MPRAGSVSLKTFAGRVEMENRPGNRIIFASGAGMDLCWLQAWAAFILYAVFKYRVPLFFVLFIYTCGIITNVYCHYRRRMRLQVFIIKLIAFPAAMLTATHFFLFHSNDNDVLLGLGQLFSWQKSFVDWGLTVTIVMIAGLIWNRSTSHTLKPLNPENVYHRLDLGIAALFSLMILKLLLFARFEVSVDYPDLKYLFLPFFLFGLLTIGFMLSTGKENRQYASGFQKIGVSLSFAVVMLSGGAGMVFLFYSQLIASAETLSGVLKKAGPPLEGAIVWFARLLWASNRNYESPPLSRPEGPNSHESLVHTPMETGWLTSVIQWGAAALVALIMLFIIYYLIRCLLRFLLTQTDSENSWNPGLFDFKVWLNRLKILINRCLNRIKAIAKGINSGAGLFRALASWGRRSGIQYQKNETPMEYGMRLSAAFPGLKTEIEIIVQLVYQEIYGETKLDYSRIAVGKNAKRRMAHPAFWKDRMRNRIFFFGK